MDGADVRKRKRQMEDEIASMLQSFQDDTGLCISNVTLEYMHELGPRSLVDVRLTMEVY